MAQETARLAKFAAELRFKDIPQPVRSRAKDCLIDAIAAGYRGNTAEWNGVVRTYLGAAGPGRARVLGHRGRTVKAETAALANGILIHALEIDSLRKPGMGVHPGATVVPAALAVAQEKDASGQELITALVAGFETLIRVGRATKHSIESRGLHAPGLTGPFGAAAAAGHLFGLDAEKMANAFGIAASMCSGLLEFSSSGGPLVKRLHMGRAAEAGVVAARWAAAGMGAPKAALEGKYGFLKVYCGETDVGALVDGLGEKFETPTICLKRYPAHITAHTPVRGIEVLRAEHGFTAADVKKVTIGGTQRMVEHNADRHPADPIMAQYSIPFCVAIALAADSSDPNGFGEPALRDPMMRALRDRIEVVLRPGAGGHSDWSSSVRIELEDGRVFERLQEDFPGTPSSPLDAAQLRGKFVSLIRPLVGETGANRLFARLETIEKEPGLEWLGKPGAKTQRRN